MNAHRYFSMIFFLFYLSSSFSGLQSMEPKPHHSKKRKIGGTLVLALALDDELKSTFRCIMETLLAKNVTHEVIKELLKELRTVGLTLQEVQKVADVIKEMDEAGVHTLCNQVPEAVKRFKSFCRPDKLEPSAKKHKLNNGMARPNSNSTDEKKISEIGNGTDMLVEENIFEPKILLNSDNVNNDIEQNPDQVFIQDSPRELRKKRVKPIIRKPPVVNQSQAATPGFLSTINKTRLALGAGIGASLYFCGSFLGLVDPILILTECTGLVVAGAAIIEQGIFKGYRWYKQPAPEKPLEEIRDEEIEQLKEEIGELNTSYDRLRAETRQTLLEVCKCSEEIKKTLSITSENFQISLQIEKENKMKIAELSSQFMLTAFKLCQAKKTLLEKEYTRDSNYLSQKVEGEADTDRVKLLSELSTYFNETKEAINSEYTLLSDPFITADMNYSNNLKVLMDSIEKKAD